MGNTLVVNPGSTSRKYAWYRGTKQVLVVTVETTPAGLAVFVTEASGQTTQRVEAPSSLVAAFTHASAIATEYGVETERSKTKVVLRVVAPGEVFARHQLWTSELDTALAAAASLVPLHIPIVQAERQAITTALPDAVMIAASDSALHANQDARVAATGLTSEAEQKHGWRRFGYHGLSVASIARQLQEREGVLPARTIVCHLGGGVSVTALKDGQSIATSMGLTPASGVAMGTRGGDIAADELAALLTVGDITTDTMWNYLYTKTGWYGKTGQADLRAVLDAASDPSSQAATAIDAFVYQVQAYIAQYAVLLGGVDRIVLTGTAAVRNSYIRARVLRDLDVLGVTLDSDANESLRGNGVLTAASSPVTAEVMANDEFGEMVRIADAF